MSATIAAALLLALCGGAAAATPSHVVPPNGKVGGKGYSYFLGRWDKAFYHSSAACQTATVGGLRVAVVFLAEDHLTCTEPAGRPIFLGGPADECSTIPGDHNGFGTTASQLKQCARAGLKAFSDVKAWVDGHRVPHYARFITATKVLAVRLPKHRFPGIKQRKGRSADYGYGLLLRGLPQGTHSVRQTFTLNETKIDNTLTLRVQ